MELKGYQRKVLNDLTEFLEYVVKHKDVSTAFNTFWSDKVGPYNPLDGTGMQPYKNTVPTAIQTTLKVPTAGGKTFIAINALQKIFSAYHPSKPKLVVWLVPWSNLLDQTLGALQNPAHPYRQKLNSLFNNRVEVYERSDLLQGANFSPTSVQEQLTLVVMSFASLRARKKEDRKVYQENGQLAAFARQSEEKDDSYLLPEVDETALINVIRRLRPVVVVDESHNAESKLSVDMLKNLHPSFILDLTATPKKNSNIVSFVPAFELKKENMVKLPVIVYNHQSKTEVISSALQLQQKLERLAKEEEKNGGKYIRPIVLFQAQANKKADNTTFEKLKKQLIDANIPAEQIKIKTAKCNELKGIDLMSRDCPVRYIITINALKEGWDCPFAYVLASVANKASAVEVEQILGRVLRQPYIQKHDHALLNVSYVLTASSKSEKTLKNIVQSLQTAGFSDEDYRAKDVIPKVKPIAPTTTQKDFFPLEHTLDEIDTALLKANMEELAKGTATSTIAVQDIEQMAEEQNKLMEKRVAKASQSAQSGNLFNTAIKVKQYPIKKVNQKFAQEIALPNFFLNVPANVLFSTEKVPLTKAALLKDFELSKEDSKIGFEELMTEIYKIDLDEYNEHEATVSHIEVKQFKDPLIKFILAKPKEQQIKDITSQLVQKIGNMFPIADQEIKQYVTRIVAQLSTDQLKDALTKPYVYKDKIKQKINALASKHAEKEFDEKIKINTILTKNDWKFKPTIILNKLSTPITKSLYKKEGEMNNFEEKVILNISSFSNIVFWHRNLERGKGFYINSFDKNHYPDFILYTKKKNIILLETKGDHLDNSDSTRKIKLGNTWASKSGPQYYYFMVFDKKSLDGAYTLDKAMDLLRQI